MRKHFLTIVFFLILAAGFIGTLCNLGTDFSFAERRVLVEFPKADSLSLNRWTWDECGPYLRHNRFIIISDFRFPC